jgi:C4-dicarboxylate-specific signal transduction histidine kinase
MFDNDEILFAAEDEDSIKYDGSYRVLIVDDEEEIHTITKLALNNFEYNNKNIEFISAYSAKEAKEILSSTDDISLILLDVIMESDKAGLEVVEHIRDSLDNHITRIVLRTGQPADVPEERVIKEYDINDYKSKTELTSTKLFTVVLSSIRSYDAIISMLNAQEISRQKDDMLLQQSKMATMGEMIGMIAHQWKQPLSNISANVSTTALKIKLGTFEQDDILNTFDSVMNQVKYMSTTVDDFKNFFQPNKLKEQIEIKKVYESSMSIISSILKVNGIKLIEKFGYTPKLNTYPNELLQVFLNIINNAKDALIEKNIENPQIEITTYSDEEYITIEFCDNAGGIPEDIIDTIFEPYFTTKGKEGTGLGLHMSKVIVEKNLNGKLSVQNGNNGAKFTIKLPLE